MQPEVTFNQEKNGIELRFTDKPSTQIRTELYNMGFRYHRGKKFWYAPVTEARIVFAKRLQQAPDVTPETETLEPSFEATTDNITAGNFSYVTFALKDGGKKTSLEDYIVFEPVKGKAETLAKQFAQERYGEKLKEISVRPRNYKRKARELFQHGNIIGKALQREEANTSITEDGNHDGLPAPLEQPGESSVSQDEGTEDQVDVANVHPAEELTDPLTNEHGVYTRETAGENFERIEIPMTKSSKHEGQIDIVKTSAGDYRFGAHIQKFYGNYAAGGFAPNLEHTSYLTRKEALIAALQWIYDRIKSDEPNDKGVKLALGAVLAYASSEGIELEEKEIKNEGKAAKSDSANADKSEYNITLTAEDVQEAQWTEADEEYPVNKAIIHGVAYHQARLRKILLDRLSKLPLEDQLAVAGKVKEHFRERRALETYDQSYVTYGKKGKDRQSIIIGLYIDDIVIDNDLVKGNGHPVLTLLLDILSGANKESVKTSEQISGEAKQELKITQEELNRQIENLIDKKFPGKIPFTEEEKNLISQYYGHAPGRAGLIPDEIIQFIWKIANQYGYKEGSVLDPCVGTGNLFRYAPKEAKVIGYDHHSFATTIAKILYPFATIHQQPFESIFFDENDNHLKDRHQAPEFELVISCPSGGQFTGMFGYLDEKHWTHADQYAEYCMTRGLDLLRREGLLIFLMPFDFMQGPSSKVKEAISKKSKLIDAFRIESLQTDIVVLRKKQSI